MRIIADSGADVTPAVLDTLQNVTIVPLIINLSGETLRSGIDISSADFYDKLLSSDDMPTTSQPSPGDYVEVFQREGASDDQLFVLTISSGLSGTYNAAKTASDSYDGPATVTLYDGLTLSAANGWLLQIAARMAATGASPTEITGALDSVRDNTLSAFTLEEMRYLVHGGRVSHLRGLLASTLKIKPVIGVDNDTGRYEQLGRGRTVKRAFQNIIDNMQQRYGAETTMRAQLVHGMNIPGTETLKTMLEDAFRNVNWLPTVPVSPVLGAHTGPTIVGVAAAPEDVFAALPVAVE